WCRSSYAGLADSWASLSSRPCLPCCRKNDEQQGPFAPRALPRFRATTGPSATLSSSADFPVLPVIRPTQLPPFRVGTRRASPVARCVLVVVPSLTTPPERPAASTGLRRAVQPSPYSCGLGLRGYALSGPPRVHWRYGPNGSHLPPGEGRRGASGPSGSLPPALPATGLPILTPTGLTPAEHTSLSWTHNRTCSFHSIRLSAGRWP